MLVVILYETLRDAVILIKYSQTIEIVGCIIVLPFFICYNLAGIDLRLCFEKEWDRLQ
jgi:hypothetical protein